MEETPIAPAGADNGASGDVITEEVLTPVVPTDDPVALKEQLAKKDEQNRRLFERAKKAEGFVKGEDGKWVKKASAAPAAPVAPKPADQPNAQAPSAEELRLIARGLSDDDIEQAKAISAGKKISLTDALKDPLFVAYQEKQAEQKKRDAAKLPASRGSGQGGDEPIVKSGMTREEHKAAFEKAQGK